MIDSMPEKPDPVPNRRRTDNCFIRNMWAQWGPQIQIAGYVPVFILLCTCVWNGFGFVRDAQADHKEVAVQHSQIDLINMRDDRMSMNLELLMRQLSIRSIRKSDLEIDAEHQVQSQKANQ